MGGIALFSGKNCTVGRLVANPQASQQHDGGRVVEIGANRQSCEPFTLLVLKQVLDVVVNVAPRRNARQDQ
jgi:hypothetical protein